MILIAKLAGCLLLAFVGYFVIAAVGWPGDLDAMITTRGIVGGAIILLAGLLAYETLRRRARPAAARPAGPARPSGLDATLPEALATPEPGPAPGHPIEQATTVITGPAAADAIELTAPILVEAPAPHPSSLAAAHALLTRGDALFGEGRLEDSLEPYSEALDAARSLHGSAPSAETQDLLAGALKAVGDVHDEMGRLDPAAAHYEEALRLRIGQLEAAPADPARKRSVSLLLERLGDTRESRGHITRALDLYRQSLPLAQGLVDADPGNPIYRDDLATTRRRIAELEQSPLV